jgi:hypothetical protein
MPAPYGNVETNSYWRNKHDEDVLRVNDICSFQVTVCSDHAAQPQPYGANDVLNLLFR